ncbi:MAG: ferredoxin [Betaproteobacteria bacterium]|nr:ferredoxin [Betaproteobacteria bacterium]
MDAFREGTSVLAIDLDDYFDCSICVSEYSVEVICSEADLPADQIEFLSVKAEVSATLPVITRQKLELPQAAYWATVKHKRHLLQRQGGAVRTGDRDSSGAISPDVPPDGAPPTRRDESA